jgi:ABC-type glycerol-3-phosphate transport system permease component
MVMPNSRGAISTATLFTFLGAWKSYTWPLIITTKTEYRTLPIGLKYLLRNPAANIS